MGRLSRYIWRYWRSYLFGGLCLLGTATLVMWIPWWIREAVRVIEHGGPMRDVTYYAVLIIAAAVVQGVVRAYSRALIFNAGRTVEYDLRNDLFAHLQKLPLSFYHNQRTGDLMSRVINDISAVRIMLGPGVLNFVNAPLYYVYAVALMLSMDVRMTLAALAPFPLLMYVAAKFRGRIMKSSLQVQQQMSVLSSHVQENLSGMHVVKAYAQEQFQAQQFIGLNKDYEVKSLEMAKMRGIVNPIMQGINGLTVLIVIWYGGVRVMRGDLLVADIVAFIAYLNVLAWPTAAFGWMLSLVERGRAAMRRLEEILATTPAIASMHKESISCDRASRHWFRPIIGTRAAVVLLTGLGLFLYSHEWRFSGSGSRSDIVPRLDSGPKMNQFDLAASAVEAKTSTKIPQPTLPAPQIQPLSLPDQNASRAPLEEATNVSAGEEIATAQQASTAPIASDVKKAQRPLRGDKQKPASNSADLRVIGASFVRSRPAANAEIIATLRPGTRIQVTGPTGEYYGVRSLGTKTIRGYVHKEDAFFERKR